LYEWRVRRAHWAVRKTIHIGVFPRQESHGTEAKGDRRIQEQGQKVQHALRELITTLLLYLKQLLSVI